MRPCYVAPGFDFLLKMLRDGIIRLAYADADSDTVSGAPSLTPFKGRIACLISCARGLKRLTSMIPLPRPKTPPLQKPQGRGTQKFNTALGCATRPVIRPQSVASANGASTK
jgi:hypothetical protein